jgi:large subunit ribosomal protein L32
MAVPKKKVTKRRKRNRRSHDAIRPPAISICPHCKAPKAPHQPCKTCGRYKNRIVFEKIK